MKFLLVDDEMLALQNLKKNVLEVVPNADILGYNSSIEALAYIKSGIFDVDVALLDINMPVVNGIQLANEIKQRSSKVNIIFCTGYSDYAIDAFGVNASGYLMKPITRDSIAEQLRVLRFPTVSSGNIEVKCFGFFNIMSSGRPVLFTRKKAKEIFAILIDRRGTKCSYEEIKDILWEDKSPTHESYFRDLKRSLHKTCKEYNIEDVFIDDKTCLALDTSKISCDYFDWLDDKCIIPDDKLELYMPAYSWAKIKK